MDQDQSELIAQFSSVTGASPETARGALQASDWQLQDAVSLYYASQDGHGVTDDVDPAASSQQAQAPLSAPQSTASIPSSSAAPSSSSRKQTQQTSKLRTLKDLQSSSAGSHDDDDSDDDPKQDFFAGGEKSGLAVQNPNHNSNNPSDLIKNIINRAKQNIPRPGGGDEDEQPQRPSNFTGRAQTLGGDDAPSQVVEDPNAQTDAREELPLVQRTLHLWNDGFSVDDGDLYRFDDPANAAAVALINQGRAPQSILNVQHNQRVDLNLIPHKTDFVQPKKVYKPFSGEGQRLGSPGPSLVNASSSSTTSTVAVAASTSTGSQAQSGPSTNPQQSISIDESQPAVTIQIRMGDGSRVSTRFNTTHSIGALYEHVEAVSSAAGTGTERQWTLMTTFPSTELVDKSISLGDVDALKKGGVVVQKSK